MTRNNDIYEESTVPNLNDLTPAFITKYFVTLIGSWFVLRHVSSVYMRTQQANGYTYAPCIYNVGPSLLSIFFLSQSYILYYMIASGFDSISQLCYIDIYYT